MKDMIISGKRIRTELLWMLACFIVALGFSVYSIFHYRISWAAFITSLHKVVMLAMVFYVMLLFFRALYTLVMRLSTRKRNT